MFDKRPIEEQQLVAASSPFNRIGRAEDIADVVAFLASEESRWVTGQHIVANGGARF